MKIGSEVITMVLWVGTMCSLGKANVSREQEHFPKQYGITVPRAVLVGSAELIYDTAHLHINKITRA
jgi:hypothetical protein